MERPVKTAVSPSGDRKPGHAVAYSFMAETKDKTILLAYESSDSQKEPHGKIMMARMNLKWVESQK